MQKIINTKYSDLKAIAEEYKDIYKNADPYPNHAFNNFFNPDFLDKVLAEFPDMSTGESIIFDNKNEKKFAGMGEKRFGKNTKYFMNYLNSEPFLDFLQTLTGIEETIIPDPYYYGGGQHEIKPGGLLKIHADFSKHEFLDLDRRINVLIYLNKNWKEKYGGYFELWDKNMEKAEKKILPTYNTMAIFSTTDYTYHGHPDPLRCPDDMSRKSLALYYYSNGRPASEISKDKKGHETLFKGRKGKKDDVDIPKFNFNYRKAIKDITPPVIARAIKKIRS